MAGGCRETGGNPGQGRVAAENLGEFFGRYSAITTAPMARLALPPTSPSAGLGWLQLPVSAAKPTWEFLPASLPKKATSSPREKRERNGRDAVMMHRLTNTHPRLQEQGPAWAALHPAPGDGPWGAAVAIWFIDTGSFQNPISGEGESVIDIPPKGIAPRNFALYAL